MGRKPPGLNPSPSERNAARKNRIGGCNSAFDRAGIFLLQTALELFHGDLPKHGYSLVGSVLVRQTKEVGRHHHWFPAPACHPTSRLSRLVVRPSPRLVAVGAIPFLAIRGGAQPRQVAG